MIISKKSISDKILIELTKFQPTSETRLDEDYIYDVIDTARAEAIIGQYKTTGIIDPIWKQDLGLVSFHKVNFADTISLTACECDIAKAFLPQLIPLEGGDGSPYSSGLTIISSCGKTKYYPYSLAMWREIPKEHERNMFRKYDFINDACYVDNTPAQLRIFGVLSQPEEGKLIQSEPIASGGIVSGTVYLVKYGQIIYDGSAYPKNSTFTGTAVTIFSGTGTVYLSSQIISYRELDPYPVSADMARQIVLDVLIKEFGIEKQATAEQRADSRDDATKPK